MEITKSKKTLFGRRMAATRREVLNARIAEAKAEAETKNEAFDLEKAKVELSPSNEETRFITLKNICDEIEAAKPDVLAFLLAPAYPRLKWVEESLLVWEEKYLPSALRETNGEASHFTPLQALIYIKTARNAATAEKKSVKTQEEIMAEKAARKERKAAKRRAQQDARAAKEPKRQAAREARKAKAAAKGNNGGKSKGKKKK